MNAMPNRAIRVRGCRAPLAVACAIVVVSVVGGCATGAIGERGETTRAAFDGIWRVVFVDPIPLDATSDLPCFRETLGNDASFVVVENRRLTTFFFAGRTRRSALDADGRFALAGPSGYAVLDPDSRERLPDPVQVDLSGQLDPAGAGAGQVLMRDPNGRYADCLWVFGMQREGDVPGR